MPGLGEARDKGASAVGAVKVTLASGPPSCSAGTPSSRTPRWRSASSTGPGSRSRASTPCAPPPPSTWSSGSSSARSSAGRRPSGRRPALDRSLEEPLDDVEGGRGAHGVLPGLLQPGPVDQADLHRRVLEVGVARSSSAARWASATRTASTPGPLDGLRRGRACGQPSGAPPPGARMVRPCPYGYRDPPCSSTPSPAPRTSRTSPTRSSTTSPQEIREFVVDAVDDAGSGHLGSNLGAVELTLALHRVFDSPQDIILWDTGHQAYVHKILTGAPERLRPTCARRAACRATRAASRVRARLDREQPRLDRPRPTPTAWPWPRRPSSGEGRRVVAVIGDGSMTGGMAFEGLNNLGHSRPQGDHHPQRQRPLLRPDDLPAGREPGPPPRSTRRSLRQQARVERTIQRPARRAAHWLERASTATKAARPRDVGAAGVLRARSASATRAPSTATTSRASSGPCATPPSSTGPIVVHVLTQKGQGYAAGRARPDQAPARHRRARSPARTPRRSPRRSSRRPRSAPSWSPSPRPCPTPPACCPSTSASPAGCFDVGIAEQHAVTSAAGMAMGGLRPVVAVYSTFLTRAIDQVIYDVGLHGQPVVFCLDRAGITGDDGPSHHGVLDMVAAPQGAGHDDVRPVLVPGARRDAPRRPRALRRARPPSAGRRPRPRRSSPTRSAHGLRGPPGRAGHRRLPHRRGQDARPPRTEAADALEAEGISVTVWDPRVVKPLDPEHGRRRRRAPGRGHRRGRPARRRRRLAHRRRRRAAATRTAGPPGRACWACPTAYIPHGKPDAILAELGLDAAGIAARSPRTWSLPCRRLGPAYVVVGVLAGVVVGGVDDLGDLGDGLADGRSMPSRRVMADTAQPWQPPPIVT